MKNAFDAVREFEEQIETFCSFVFESYHETVKSVCLDALSFLGELERKDLVFSSGTVTPLAESLCSITSPLIPGGFKPWVFIFLGDRKETGKFFKEHPEFKERFESTCQAIELLAKDIPIEHWNWFNQQQRIKNSPYPSEPRVVRTVQDLLVVLGDVPHKDTPIDSLRIPRRDEGMFDIDLFSGEFRGEVITRQQFDPKTILEDTVISSSLTVQGLIDILKLAHLDAFINDIRLKGADNAIYFAYEEDGVVMHD